MTPEEADKAYDEAPAIPMSDGEIKWIVKSVMEIDPSPITTDSLIQEFGFKQVDGAPDQCLSNGVLETAPEYVDREGDRRWSFPDGWGWRTMPKELKPRTKGQLRRLLSLLEDIAAKGESQ